MNNLNNLAEKKNEDSAISEFQKLGTERVNMLVELVCSVNSWSYHDLADALGVNRGWFTRSIKGGIGEWDPETVLDLIKIAADIPAHKLKSWVFVNYTTTAQE